MESFKGRLREECLNSHWFLSLANAPAKIEAWWRDYNESRRHTAFGWLTPAEYAASAEINPADEGWKLASRPMRNWGIASDAPFRLEMLAMMRALLNRAGKGRIGQSCLDRNNLVRNVTYPMHPSAGRLERNKNLRYSAGCKLAILDAAAGGGFTMSSRGASVGRVALAAGTALVTIAWAVAGAAQTPTEAAAPGPPAEQTAQAADTGGLAEIIVTAQKRSESLQRTPLAISAVTSATIETRRIEDATQLNAVAPSLSVTTSPANRDHLVVYIRGVGESDPILTNDSPVGVYVDGVILGRSTGSVFELVDLERIEVLRGPQGTLYGRNTTGGAINLITKKPSDKFGVDVRGSYGNRDYFQGRGSIDTGLIGGSGFKAKISYVHKQADGFVNNVNAKGSRDPGAYNTDAVRAVLAYDDGGPFRASYAFDWADTVAVPTLPQLVAVGANQLAYFSQSPAFGGAVFQPPSTKRRGTSSLDISRSDDRNISHVGTLEYDVGDHLMIRSLTGYRRWRNIVTNTDLDSNTGLRGLVVSPAFSPSAPVQLFGADSDRRQHQFSQEIDLIGSIGDKIDYVVGGFYFRERARELNPQSFTVVIPAPVAGLPPLVGVNLTSTLAYGASNQSEAGFGQATYHFNDKLSFTGGLRYTADQKTLDQSSPIVRSLSRDFSRVNGAATLQYQFTPRIMTYARYATGYKAGGFNARSVNNGYEPESVRSYEIGAKSELFHRRLRLNGTLFWMDLKNKQITQFAANASGAGSQTLNAGKSRYKGVEIEFDALPIDALQINGAIGYTDRTYRELLAQDPNDPTAPIENYADVGKFAYSPSTTYNIGAEYTIKNVATGNLSFRLEYAYKSKVTFDVFPNFAPFTAYTKAPGYGLLDGRVQLANLALGGGEATVSLWGKNLTDKHYRTGSIDFGSALGFAVTTYGETRSYGVDVRYRF